MSQAGLAFKRHYAAMLSAAPAPEGGAVLDALKAVLRTVAFMEVADYLSTTPAFKRAIEITGEDFAALAAREEAPAEVGDEGPCTCCDDTGWTIQTEQACSCIAGDQYRAQPPAREDAQPVAWRLLAQQQPKPGHKIVTLHDDGSGAALLFVYDGGVIDSDGDDYTKIGSPQTWWTYLPDGFEFWCEGISEDPVTLPEHRKPDHPAPGSVLAVAAALKPFAMAARGLSSRWGDHETHWQGATSPIAVEDLRRADQALAALQAERGAK